MVAKNNLFILFQNQLVEYIHKIQKNLSQKQYDQFKKYFTLFKEADYDVKMTMLVEFINNLMEFNNAVISKDSSIFASDDIIYGDRESICLIPDIDFRPLVKIDEHLMWETIQKMYAVASKIVDKDPNYSCKLTTNMFDSFIDSFNSAVENDQYKSTEFLKRIWSKFTEKLNNDKELYEFKKRLTNDLSIDQIMTFVNNNRESIVKMIKHIIYISHDTFNEEIDNINVFDLRDDFIVLMKTLDNQVTSKDNRMMVKSIANIAKGIPFFADLQKSYNNKFDVEGLHDTICKLIEAANNFQDTGNIVEKIQSMLSSVITKVEDESFDKSIGNYIASATKQVTAMIPMLENIMKKKK